MHLLPLTAAAAMLCYSALGNLQLRPAGWLDQLVQSQKKQFIKDVRKEAPVNLQASFKSPPPGYVDSTEWTLPAVLRLLALIHRSEGAAEVRGPLRRALAPSRRVMMSRPLSFKHFPSLAVDHGNYLYYPVGSEEVDYEPGPDAPWAPSDDDILYISNPVEAHLPSARISVRLLKDIMEARAMAARVMPTTTRATIKWLTTTAAPGGTGSASAAGAGNDTTGDATTGGDAAAADTPTGAGGGEETTAGGEQEAPPAE